MPRFFFDIHDGIIAKDTEGMEFRDFNQMRLAAKRLLPVVPKDKWAFAGDDKSLTVSVRDILDAVVYTVYLDFQGKIVEFKIRR